MGFANLSIAEIAADYSIPVEKLFSLDNQLLIADKHQKSRLALEDAKAIIFRISSEVSPKGRPFGGWYRSHLKGYLRLWICRLSIALLAVLSVKIFKGKHV
ncbi:MAG: hypothetical protein RMY62_010445 [Nostoc sp. ZfuVER08]|jgi:hypothetical protein|uniref:hypothetical protein n=1 Tax=Nostoc punctiforme TaxID=272131 RepID=UPI001F557E3E|nr:hypothetical protein [Nostoc punctiforme]MDZ8013500.1 hypothetical protein [Nostoc sp. ZfuVER08]